ncbi:MAG: hypothetical protein IK095_00070 [Oscillospiraceae bacterium]|nr:hypothetical protein [Oscillospiraceae bacterium]
MNVDPELMQQYADYMEECSGRIQRLCTEVENCVSMASQCMDSVGGLAASKRLLQSMETIRANIAWAEDACKRLVLSKKHVIDAQNTMGGR